MLFSFTCHCVLHAELDYTAEQAFIWLPLVSVIVPSHREDSVFTNENINFKKILVTSLHLKHKQNIFMIIKWIGFIKEQVRKAIFYNF